MNRGEAEGPEFAPALVSTHASAAALAPVAAVVTAKRPVLSATAAEWRGWMIERGDPAYRARQVLDWVIRRRAQSFEPMSDLPKSLRIPNLRGRVVMGGYGVSHACGDRHRWLVLVGCFPIECREGEGEIFVIEMRRHYWDDGEG